MIMQMTSTIPAGPITQTDRAVILAQAMELTRGAATSWLTPRTVAAIGKGTAASITRYRRAHRRYPTWAEALTGVDPVLLTPMVTPPEDWPLQAAVWRRQLRLRLMGQLKHTRWITYTPALRSLRVGARGQAWLTSRPPAANPTPPDND